MLGQNRGPKDFIPAAEFQKGINTKLILLFCQNLSIWLHLISKESIGQLS